MKKKNLKTTISGFCGAVGIALTQFPDEKVKLAGSILTAFSVFVLGYHAQDTKTS